MQKQSALPSLPWMCSQHSWPTGCRRQAGLEPRTAQDLKTVQVSNVLWAQYLMCRGTQGRPTCMGPQFSHLRVGSPMCKENKGKALKERKLVHSRGPHGAYNVSLKGLKRD